MRHVVEVPDIFAIARWRRDADVATIARLATLKYEPHTTDTTALRHRLESVISDASSFLPSLMHVEGGDAG